MGKKILVVGGTATELSPKIRVKVIASSIVDTPMAERLSNNRLL